MIWSHEQPLSPIHDRLPYQAIVDRRAPLWPGGSKIALWVIPNVEHYEFLPPSTIVDPYPRTPHPDVRKFSYHDFGNRVGIWRMLDVLDRWNIRCTVSLNVAVLDHYPDIAEALSIREYEFMSHGIYNTRYLTGLTRSEESEFFDRADAVLHHHTGQHFAGMLGPNITGNSWTPDLMAEKGMTYHADWVHDERPAPLRTKSGAPIIALPYSYSLNDAPLLMRSHVEGAEYAQRCKMQFDELYDRPENAGRMMALPLHPFTIGQPHRIKYLDEVLGHIRSRSDVWIATGSEIASFYADTCLEEDLTYSDVEQ